jgi:hypothetical protein
MSLHYTVPQQSIINLLLRHSELSWTFTQKEKGKAILKRGKVLTYKHNGIISLEMEKIEM